MKKHPHLQAFFAVLFFSISLLLTSQAQAKAHSENAELESVSLQLKWLHQFQFAGYYAAKFKGFYENEGLDVTIKERDLFANNIEQVIAGESEYGIADSMLLLYQSKGAPLKIVAPIFQHSPQVFITLKSSGINSLYDLEGREVTFYQKDTDGFPLLAMLHHNQVEVDLQRMLVKAGPKMLEAGKVDAYPAYLSNEPYYFYQKDIDINIIHPMNYGIDLYGDLIFTHTEETEHNPERVERFKRASIKGWQYALQHKEEVIDYIINELRVEKSREHLLYEAKVIEDAIQANSIPIGTLNKGRLQFIQNLFVKHKLINNKIDLSTGIYQTEQHSLSFDRNEIAWMKRNPQVKVAIDTIWHPIEFVNNKGEYDGIVKGYFDYIHAKTGIDFIPSTELTWSEAVEEMKAGRLDMYGAVIKTPERQEYTRFTQPYLKFPMVIATQKGENYIPDLSKLRNKTIAVVEHYAAHELVRDNYPNLNLYLVKSTQEGLSAVSNGNAYGYVDNLAVVGFHIRQEGLSNLQISGETPFDASVGMAIRKDWPELHSILTKVFASIDSQTQAKLNNPWLQVQYKQVIEWQKILYIALPIVLLMLIIVFYNRKLSKLNHELSTTNQNLVDAQQTLKVTNERLEILSVTDFLTGAYNRQYIDKALKQEVNRCDRYEEFFSLLLIDLDNFKQVNDQYGHLVGDQVLKTVYEQLQSETRVSDIVGRWGGEEFVVICPSTDLEHAKDLADKIIQNLAQLEFEQGFVQTTSIGIATFTYKESISSLIERADKNLYQAKHQGKNQACF